jgi:hypothetical protein
MATLKEYLLKERELDNSSKPNRIRTKDGLPEKIPLIKKELFTLSPVDVAEGC